MQRIPLKLSEPGMIVNAAVEREDGMVLVGPGITLTEPIIGRLLSAGVTHIEVKGCPFPHLREESPVYRVPKRLDHLFRNFRENQFMWTLRNMIEQHFSEIAAQMYEEENPGQKPGACGEQPACGQER